MTLSAPPGIGSSFESFLDEQGNLEEATEVAMKRILAWQIAQAMATQNLSKAEMARRMKTSRAQLDRLLSPTHIHVELHTLQRAAQVLGKRLRLDLEDVAAAPGPAGA